ncbi:hypothetical protein JCM11641_002784 [Rhodosporidiobolus odoratus]
MFSSWFSPAPSDEASFTIREPLTPLPPKLRFRSPSTTSNTSRTRTLTHSPTTSPSLSPTRATTLIDGRRDSVRSEVSEWRGHSFAELLSRDPRQSVLMHEGGHCEPEPEQRGRTARRQESMLVLPGGDFGITGRDSHLLLQELHRARVGVAQKKRRHTAYLAGSLSVLYLGSTVWFFVEICASLIQEGGKGRGSLRWVQLSFFLTLIALWVVILAFVRTRRVSTLAPIALLSAAFSSFLQLSLAFINFVLSFVWKAELASRCAWGVDVAWTIGKKGDTCAVGFGWKGWSVAATVRLIITILFLVAWLFSLRAYNLTLHTPLRISPSALPSSELRAILERHRADIVPLAPEDASHTHHLPHDLHGADSLPAMPDRAAHCALITEAEQSELYSYRGSEHTRAGSGEAGKSQGAVSAWMGAKLWGGVGWLFGVQPYGDAPMGTADPEKGAGAEQEKANPAPRRSLEDLLAREQCEGASAQRCV